MSPLTGPGGRRARATLAVFLAALALALGARAVRSRQAAGLPTAGAEWIWAPLGRTVEPLAFYAARDFELPAVPATARLSAAADEEYVLYLNGRRVGSGGAPPGSRPALDAYDVAPLLRAGPNRLVAELRSGRGAGGFLARLADGRGRTLAATDASWRILRRYHPGLVRGWLPLAGAGAAESEAAASWSRPPIGRWGMLGPAVARPLFAGGEPAVALPLAATVSARENGVWIDLGRAVDGYLALEVAPRSRRQIGVLDAGPPLSRTAAVQIVVAPGATLWTDPLPRRLRAFPVEGRLAVLGARVYPSAIAPVPPVPEDQPAKGLLGLTPPLLGMPVEQAVWRELLGTPVQYEVWREGEGFSSVTRWEHR